MNLHAPPRFLSQRSRQRRNPALEKFDQVFIRGASWVKLRNRIVRWAHAVLVMMRIQVQAHWFWTAWALHNQLIYHCNRQPIYGHDSSTHHQRCINTHQCQCDKSPPRTTGFLLCGLTRGYLYYNVGWWPVDGGCSCQVFAGFGSDAIVMMRLQQKLETDVAVR